MTDAVTNTTLMQGQDKMSISITNRSDGSGETNASKVVLATIFNQHGQAATRAGILEVQYSIVGFTSVSLSWDHAVDDVAMQLAAGNGYRDFRGISPLMDPQSVGGTGNLLLTTFGAAANATYDITIILAIRFPS